MKNKISSVKDYLSIRQDGWTGLVLTDFEHVSISCLVDPDFSGPQRSGFEKVQSSDTAQVCRFTIILQDSEKLLYLKRYPYRSVIDALKHLLRPSRAKRAFEAGLMLQKYDFYTPPIVAFLHKKDGLFSSDDILITQAMTNATALSAILDLNQTDRKQFTLTEKRSLIVELGKTIGRLHLTGIFHGDLRLGNIFVLRESGNWRFIFIDNERTVRCHPLPFRLRRKNLVQLNMHLANISVTDRIRFLNAYRFAARLSPKYARRLARSVAVGTRRRFRRRARTRTGITDASGPTHWNFQRARLGRLDGIFRTDFVKADTAAQLLRQIENLMAAGTVLKDGPSTRVVRCTYNGRDIVIKRYNYQGLWHALRHAVKGSRAKKCWRFGHRLNAAKIPCAQPLGMIENHAWGIVRQSYILNAFVEGPMLYTLMTSPEYSEEQKQAVRKKAEDILEQLAKHQMTHSDMKSVNMLVHEDKPFLIDLDSMQKHWFWPYFQLRNQKMLRKFNDRLYGGKY